MHLRSKKYRCENGCALPPRKKHLGRFDDGTYGYDYFDPNFCPHCGTMFPYTREKIATFFKVYNLHPKLDNAVTLIYKSEFESAAREAFVTVENILKQKSGLDSHGFDLPHHETGALYPRQLPF